MIGLELNILKGWYLALIIILTIANILTFGFECLKKGMEQE